MSALFRQPDSTRAQPERILLVMGNMIALPQIILFFAMLDIFSYNSYQIHILPGPTLLREFFIQAVRQAWKVN